MKQMNAIRKLTRRLKRLLFRKRPMNFTEKQQAEVEFRMQLYAFKKQKREIESRIIQFEQMAFQAERNNQHDNALLAVRLRRRLIHMQERIDGVILNYEMLHSLGSIGESMNAFMQGCEKFGLNLRETINQINVGQSSDSVQEGLAQLDYLCNSVDHVFDCILKPSESLGAATESTPEDEMELARMIAQGSAEAENPQREPLSPQQAQRVERLRMSEQA